MLMFLLYVGKERFAIETEHANEVLPRVQLKEMLNAPQYVAGLLNFGGISVPVIDLCSLIAKRPSADCLHSRIILFKFQNESRECLVGLMAEKITQAIQHERPDFIDSGIKVPGAPYLDGIYTDKEGVIQFIIMEELFAMIKKDLFTDTRHE